VKKSLEESGSPEAVIRHSLPSSPSGSTVPSKYRKRIVSSEQLWNFFKDCRVCPVILSKRSLELLIIEFHEDDLHRSSCIDYFHEDLVSIRKLLYPTKVLLSEQFSVSQHKFRKGEQRFSLDSKIKLLMPELPMQSYQSNRHNDTSPVTTAPSVESTARGGKPRISIKAKAISVSFQTFLKVYSLYFVCSSLQCIFSF
jgi:hypothetical protein